MPFLYFGYACRVEVGQLGKDLRGVGRGAHYRSCVLGAGVVHRLLVGKRVNRGDSITEGSVLALDPTGSACGCASVKVYGEGGVANSALS